MLNIATGYTDPADYCPYCGERIYEYAGDNKSICKNEECKAKFYVIEADDSEKEW